MREKIGKGKIMILQSNELRYEDLRVSWDKEDLLIETSWDSETLSCTLYLCPSLLNQLLDFVSERSQLPSPKGDGLQ